MHLDDRQSAASAPGKERNHAVRLRYCPCVEAWTPTRGAAPGRLAECHSAPAPRWGGSGGALSGGNGFLGGPAEQDLHDEDRFVDLELGAVTEGQESRARRPEQKRARQDAILAAAITLLDDNGLEPTSLSAIARASGVSQPNIYRYFESREAILLAVTLDEVDAWLVEPRREWPLPLRRCAASGGCVPSG